MWLSLQGTGDVEGETVKGAGCFEHMKLDAGVCVCLMEVDGSVL